MSSMLIVFLTRALLVMLFLPFSALDKILNFRQAVAQAGKTLFAPQIAAGLIVAGFALEVVMSLAILTGVSDRLAALCLAAYCVLTAVLWKQFWKAPDFRLQGESRGRETFWDFLKNIALAGGFLLLAFGTNSTTVRRFFAHPLASSSPYSVVDRGGHDD